VVGFRHLFHPWNEAKKRIKIHSKILAPERIVEVRVALIPCEARCEAISLRDELPPKKALYF